MTVCALPRLKSALVASIVAVGCAPAPARVSPPVSAPAPAPAPDASANADAPDVEFLHHMIPHHAQALVMTALVPGRAARPEIGLIAERIAVSQRDEIALMQSWLRAHGHSVPAADTTLPAASADAEVAHGAAAHDAAHPGHAAPATSHSAMPGMLTPAQLRSLAAARGPAFDRLFLELMIRHHEGAITMVQDLFAQGGGQDSQVFAIASEVESDQRMEIARMQALLATLPSIPPRPE